MRGKALAVAIALLLAELLLRGYAQFADSRSRAHGPVSSRIWCLGDSNTRGDGAEDGQSYPEHLARALGEPVLNLGASGANSSQSLRRLERQLALQKPPEFVLFLAGSNDGWNLREVDPTLLRAARDSRMARIRRSLQGLRLFQAARAVLLRVRPGGPALGARHDALSRTAEAIDAGEFSEALRRFEVFLVARPDAGIRFTTGLAEGLVLQELRRLAAMERGSREESLFAAPLAPGEKRAEAVLYGLGRGWWRLWLGEADAAAKDFHGLLQRQLAPIERAEALQGSGWCLLRGGRSREALAAFAEALREGEVAVRQARFFWAHAGSVIAARRSGDRERARRALQRLPAPVSAAEVRADVLLRKAGGEGEVGRLFPLTSYLENRGHLLQQPELDAEFTRRVLRSRLSGLRELSQRQGFRTVVLTYPQQSAHRLNERIREETAALDLDLVDLEGLLVDAAGRRFVSRDGYHPDAEGYLRMSERIRAEVPWGKAI